MQVKVYAVFLACACSATIADAATVRGWIGDTANYVEDSLRVDLFSTGTVYVETALGDAYTGTLKVYAAGGPNFDESLAGVSLYGGPSDPLLTNNGTSSTLEPVQVVMTYSGLYRVPETEFATANSRAMVDLLTSTGGSSASATHLVDYFGGEYRDGVIERNTGGGSVSIERSDKFGLRAKVSTGLQFMGPGESAWISYLLESNAKNGGVSAFADTAYLSIFVRDKSAFTIDPLISSWVYEFGEEGNGPDREISPVPLPAGAPLLLAGLAGLAGIRRLRSVNSVNPGDKMDSGNGRSV